jgi:PAS domain S-box-containing protein
MDGMAPIVLNGKHIANWGMGNVICDPLDEKEVRLYAQEIGVSQEELVAASLKLTKFTKQEFIKKIEYLSILGQEISELAYANYKLSEEIKKRKKSESKYIAIVKNAIVGICEIDKEGKIDFVNRHFELLSGYSSKELIGIELIEILKVEKNDEAYFHGIRSYLTKDLPNSSYDFNVKLKQKYGKDRPCRICITPQFNLSNQIIRTTAIVIDVTAEKKAIDDLKQTNFELLEKKKETELYFDNNINGLFIFSYNKHYIKANSAYMKFVSENVKEFVSEEDIWHPFKPKVLENIFAGVIKKAVIKREYGFYLYEFSATLLTDLSNLTNNILITLKDTTNYQLMFENELFNEKMSGVGMMASGIAHDLKNVFSILGNSNISIKSWVEQIEDPVLCARVQKVLQTQDLGLQNGRKLISQIFSYSNENHSIFEEFNVKESIEKILRMLNGSIMIKNISVVLNISESLALKCNTLKFTQILTNLLNNAIDALETNGIIEISVEHINDVLILSIKDNGKGISKEDKKNIFSAFFTTKKNGTGFGLFLVKKLVKDLGGTIEFKSTVDVGTEFSLLLKDNENLKIIGK